MEKALQIRDKDNAQIAAKWLEEQGIPFELAIIALIGMKKAIQYNIKPINECVLISRSKSSAPES